MIRYVSSNDDILEYAKDFAAKNNLNYEGESKEFELARKYVEHKISQQKNKSKR